MPSRLQQGIAREHPEWIIPRLCQQHANSTGVYTAIITGLLTWPVTRRFGLDKNKSLFSALGASAVGGYVTAKYSYRECENMYGFAQAVETFSNK
ncbi:unnamed protein product [Rhizopus microsporus]